MGAGIGPQRINAPVAVITGACGGIGQAAARRLGARYRLVLSDVRVEKLEAFAGAMSDEGYDIAAILAGDLTDVATLESLVNATRGAGRVGALIHTAGLSPSLASWDAIVQTNLVATDLLLDAIAPLLTPGACAILLASMAGHTAPADSAMDALFDAPKATDFHARTEAHFSGMPKIAAATSAYALGKRAILRMAPRLCEVWGAEGARICTLSPGTIYTSMGRAEAENHPAAAEVLRRTPMGRWGAPSDISSAIAFLVSDDAAFITGTDLRIDGGVTPVIQRITAGMPAS